MVIAARVIRIKGDMMIPVLPQIKYMSTIK